MSNANNSAATPAAKINLDALSQAEIDALPAEDYYMAILDRLVDKGILIKTNGGVMMDLKPISEEAMDEVVSHVQAVFPDALWVNQGGDGEPDDHCIEISSIPGWHLHLWAPSERYGAWRVNHIGKEPMDMHRELTLSSEDPNEIAKVLIKHVQDFAANPVWAAA